MHYYKNSMSYIEATISNKKKMKFWSVQNIEFDKIIVILWF